MRALILSIGVFFAIATLAGEPRAMSKRVKKDGNRTIVTYSWDDGDGDVVITETYGPDGFLTKREDKDGMAHHLQYDEKWRLIRVLRPDSSTIRIRYPDKGLPGGKLTGADGADLLTIKINAELTTFRAVDPATDKELSAKATEQALPMLKTFLLLAVGSRAKLPAKRSEGKTPSGKDLKD